MVSIVFNVFVSKGIIWTRNNKSTSCAVSDIQCSYSTVESTGQNFITAKLKRPPGFKGDPLFADERTTSPDTDYSCTIKRDPSDTHQLAYNLKIIDFNRCGVLNRNVITIH